MDVYMASRSVAIIRPDEDDPHWILMCSTPSSLAMCLLEDLDVNTFPGWSVLLEHSDEKMMKPISAAELKLEKPPGRALSKLMYYVESFLEREHRYLLQQLSRITPCPSCLEVNFENSAHEPGPIVPDLIGNYSAQEIGVL